LRKREDLRLAERALTYRRNSKSLATKTHAAAATMYDTGDVKNYVNGR
jgi:hypothetical protein